MIHLNETHAPLGEPARQQAVGGKSAVASFGAVHFQDVLRFAGKVSQFRHAALHAKRQLVLADAGGNFRVIDDLIELVVQFLHALNHFGLALVAHTGRIAHIDYRFTRGLKLHPLEFAG